MWQFLVENWLIILVAAGIVYMIGVPIWFLRIWRIRASRRPSRYRYWFTKELVQDSFIWPVAAVRDMIIFSGTEEYEDHPDERRSNGITRL